MAPPHRTLSTLLVAGILVCLAGCVAVTPEAAPSRATSVPSPAAGDDARAEDVVDCGGSDVTVQASANAVLTGDCPSVAIAGADIDADLTQARVGALVINGDRAHVHAGALTSVEISGQSNEIDASDVGSVQIAGDRNAIESDGAIGTISINGNDNAIGAATVGDVSDTGQRNSVRVRD